MSEKPKFVCGHYRAHNVHEFPIALQEASLLEVLSSNFCAPSEVLTMAALLRGSYEHRGLLAETASCGNVEIGPCSCG
jgi:hypothetical protein